MIDSATALEIARHCRALADEVHEDAYVLAVPVRDSLYRLADAIDANETVMSGIDIMRFVQVVPG